MIFSLLLVTSALAATDADPFDFRGFHLGAPESELVARMPYFNCANNGKSDGDRACSVRITSAEGLKYGPAMASAIVAKGYGGVIGSIEVNIEPCDATLQFQLFDTLRARLGDVISRIPTGAGSIVAWTGKGRAVSLIETNAGRFTSCNVTYTTAEYTAERKRRMDQAARARSGGM